MLREAVIPPLHPYMSLWGLAIRLIQTLEMVVLKEPNHSNLDLFLCTCALDL